MSRAITLRETIFFPDGKETKIFDREGWNSISQLIKAIRRGLPLSGQQIYELNTRGETEITYGGLKRKLEIVEPD